jgi:GAF domain-containing protein/HAMP domain-containing protein
VATAAASNLIEVVEASSQQALAGMLVGTGIVLLIAMVAGGLLTRQLIAPLREMVPVTESIAAGDLERRIAISQLDEIGTLARAFNTMTDQLQTLITGLEDRVADRTQRLEIVATLGEHLGAILHLEELLPEIVDQIKENFGYYHAHIYLLDEQRENLVVAAGTGDAGAEMKARGHSIALESPTSLVARAARTGQIVRVDNVRETEDWLPNPLLPDTYSEMAVPVVLDGQVVGVLDVQEDKIAGLDESDASLLRSLANQVAVTIRNAHQFEEVETALAEAHALQRQYVQQAWDRTRVTQRGISRVQYSLGGSTTLPETVISEVRQQVLSKKQLTVVTVNDGDQEKDSEQVGGNVQQAVVAPVNLHGTTIGNLQLHETDRGRKWTEGELAIVNAVVEQVAQVVENLRLFSETQERASRERLIGEVSDKLRRAPDMETLVQRAVSELAQILGPARTFVRFGSRAEFGVAPDEISDSSESPEPEQPVYIEEDLPETGATPTNGRELKVDGNGRNGA